MVQGWDWSKETLAPNLGDTSKAEERERAGDLYQQSDMVRTIQQSDGGSQKVLTSLCSTPSLSLLQLVVLTNTSHKPTPRCLAANPQRQLPHRGCSFPWSSPRTSPCNPPLAARCAYIPRSYCELWTVYLSQCFRTLVNEQLVNDTSNPPTPSPRHCTVV